MGLQKLLHLCVLNTLGNEAASFVLVRTFFVLAIFLRDAGMQTLF